MTLKTIKYYLFAILVTLLTISCDEEKVIRTPEDEHILELAYSDDYIYPNGFYHEVFDGCFPCGFDYEVAYFLYKDFVLV